MLFSNSIDYLNYVIDQSNQQGYVYRKDTQNVVVVGGTFFSEGTNQEVPDLDTSLGIPGKTLILGTTNYLYFEVDDYVITDTVIDKDALLLATIEVST